MEVVGMPAALSRKSFGALLAGYYGSDRLLFAGRVGTGFSEKALHHLYEGMQKIRSEACPCITLPEKKTGRWGQGITSAVMKRCAWVEPILVAQIKFTEWTSNRFGCKCPMGFSPFRLLLCKSPGGVVKDCKVVAVRIDVAASNQDLGPLGTIHYLCEFDTYEFAIRASTDRERAYSLGKALQDLFYGVTLLR